MNYLSPRPPLWPWGTFSATPFLPLLSVFPWLQARAKYSILAVQEGRPARGLRWTCRSNLCLWLQLEESMGKWFGAGSVQIVLWGFSNKIWYEIPKCESQGAKNFPGQRLSAVGPHPPPGSINSRLRSIFRLCAYQRCAGISLSLSLHGINLYIILGILTNPRLEYPPLSAYVEVLEPVCGWCKSRMHVWLRSGAEAASSQVLCRVSSRSWCETQN